MRKLFRFVILVINWNFQIIKQSDLVEGELYVANVCFSLLMVILYIGDVVSIKTKAWIPSVFVCGVLFILGYWTIFPQNIVEVAGFLQWLPLY